MRNKIAIFIAILFGVCQPNIVKAQLGLDNGTGPDGVMICPPAMALRCGLSSSDCNDLLKLVECFDKIASDTYGSQSKKQDINQTRSDVMHQYSKVFYDLAIKYKADAGDYVDKGDEIGNSDLLTDKNSKKVQEGKVTANNAKNILGLMDVFSSILVLHSIDSLFTGIAQRDISEEMKETGKETLSIDIIGGGNV